MSEEQSKINQERLMNHVLCEQMAQIQPPNAPNWRLFDEKIHLMAHNSADPSNIYDHILSCYLLMTRIAVGHRFEARYVMAEQVYLHIITFVNDNRLNAKLIPICFLNLYTNIVVMYNQWATIISDTKMHSKLLKLAIKYAKICLKCWKFEKYKKRNNIKIAKELNTVYIKHFGDIDCHRLEAQIYHHLATAHYNLNDYTSIDHNKFASHRKLKLKQSELYWNKAFDLFTNVKYTDFVFYFMMDYIKWMFEVRTNLRTNKKLIYKTLRRNVEFAINFFGELSIETINCYCDFGVYYSDYLQKYSKGMTYYEIALNICYKCLRRNEKFAIYERIVTINYELGTLSKQNGNLNEAIQCYDECILQTNKALKLNSWENVKHLKIKMAKKKRYAQKKREKIKSYTEFEREKRQSLKKHLKKWNKLFDSKEEPIQSNKECCGKCNNQKHQKHHWKRHKVKCKK